MNHTLRTNRLAIRLAKPEDAEDIFAYRSDTHENRYQGWFPDSANEVRDHIISMPETLDVPDFCYQFAIINTGKDKLIGDMGIIFTNYELAQAEIGCTLNKEWKRNGYGTEAIGTMVDYLFGTLKKHRIVVSVDPRNTASIRIMERMGFRKEAHFRESYYLRGEWADDIIYAMLRSEWEASRKDEGLYTV